MGALDGVVGRRVGVADLEADLVVVIEGLAVGVEERAIDLVGVEDLAEGAGFVEGKEAREVGVDDLAEEGAGFVEGKVAREVGVDDLEGLVAAGKVDLLVGVEGLLADFGTPEDDGLLLLTLLVLEEFCAIGKGPCFGDSVFLGAGSSGRFSSLDFRTVARVVEILFWLIRVFFWGSFSKEGKSGVSGGVRSQS